MTLRELLESRLGALEFALSGVDGGVSKAMSNYMTSLHVLLAYDAALEKIESFDDGMENDPGFAICAGAAREARQAAMKVMGINKTMGEG